MTQFSPQGAAARPTRAVASLPEQCLPVASSLPIFSQTGVCYISRPSPTISHPSRSPLGENVTLPTCSPRALENRFRPRTHRRYLDPYFSTIRPLFLPSYLGKPFARLCHFHIACPIDQYMQTICRDVSSVPLNYGQAKSDGSRPQRPQPRAIPARSRNKTLHRVDSFRFVIREEHSRLTGTTVEFSTWQKYWGCILETTAL